VDPSGDLESEDQPLLGNQDQGEEWEEGKTLLQPRFVIVFPVVVGPGIPCLSSFVSGFETRAHFAQRPNFCF